MTNKLTTQDSDTAVVPVEATADDKLGMAWWNALTERERARWSTIAGNTGRAVDAWRAFKRLGG